MKNKKIVALDDHLMFLEGLKGMLLKQDDFSEIYITTDYKEALHWISALEIDLLITDISMPKLSGIEFISLVKETHPEQKIMVLSMFPNLEAYKKINAYVLKESSELELLKAIRQVVDNQQDYFPIQEDESTQITLSENQTLLTKREKEIIQLIIQENTSEEIADLLFLSKHTVETHKKNIFLKLEVNNMAGLTKKAMQLGIKL